MSLKMGLIWSISLFGYFWDPSWVVTQMKAPLSLKVAVWRFVQPSTATFGHSGGSARDFGPLFQKVKCSSGGANLFWRVRRRG